MVAKTAKAFGVTVDYLIGEDENASFDKETVERLNDIQKINVIDTYFQNFKTKKLLLNKK